MATLLCLAGASGAEEFACSPDQCMSRINALAKKLDPSLVAAKQSCTEEGGDLRCRYKSEKGPGINLISKRGSKNVQTLLIVDSWGLSPAGGVYLGYIMEAFDTSLNPDSRKSFYNKLIGEFAGSFRKGGNVEMESGKLKYILHSLPDRTFTLIGVSHKQ